MSDDMTSPYDKTPQEPKGQTLAHQVVPQIAFTLTVHLEDGTTKDIPCVGTLTKEQDYDNRS